MMGGTEAKLSEGHLAPAATSSRTRWLAPAGIAVAAFVLYGASLAPGLTWAHQGADGGELLAAAATNGVPHPPGYPLYIPILQAWLALSGVIFPGSDLAWRGNLFSALCGAAGVYLTVVVAARLLPPIPHRWLYASIAGLAWALSPLFWSQAIITEVYSMHALLVVLLAWAVLVKASRLWYVVIPVALGVAHHLTLVLLLPAALYALVSARTGHDRWVRPLLALAGACALGALVYVRIPIAAAGAPPINWGYADNWEGFRWLVSGEAYRGYLRPELNLVLFRLTTWAYAITEQFTPVGLALGFVGLAGWDRTEPRLRNFALLWIAPVSIYSIIYYTRDSDIYLLPVVWLLSILMAVGLAVSASWLARRVDKSVPVVGVAALVLLLFLGIARWPSIALRNDLEARTYLEQVAQVVEPDSLLITLQDRETFAIWYATWGDKSLQKAAPGVIPLNDSLYQFDWYRRLLRELHPEVPAIDATTQEVVEANAAERPIFFAEPPVWLAESQLEQIGPLWRLKR